jgi:signal transduction histidine kinase
MYGETSIMDKKTYLEREKVKLQQYWLSLVLGPGTIVVVALSLLDYLVTPERFLEFLRYRAMAASLLVILYLLNKRKADRNYQILLTIAAVFTVGGMVEMMILSFGGHQSTYYAGMIIIYVFLFSFVPFFSLLLTLSFAGLIYSIYLIPILFFDSITDMRIFWNNNIFLICILTVAILSRYFNDGILLKQLSLEYDLSKEKDQLSSLMSRLSLAEENERRKIATQLHDNIGQILALVHMSLQQLARATEGVTSDSIDKIKGLVEECIQYTRSLTFELSTPLLYELGIEAAIESFGRQFQKRHGIKCRMVTYGKAVCLEDEQRIVLFQCVREALANVRRHSGASAVIVSISYRGEKIEIGIEDNGRGFDTKRSYLRENGGFGLFSLAERMKNIGGSMHMTSSPGVTNIRFIAPL